MVVSRAVGSHCVGFGIACKCCIGLPLCWLVAVLQGGLTVGSALSPLWVVPDWVMLWLTGSCSQVDLLEITDREIEPDEVVAYEPVPPPVFVPAKVSLCPHLCCTSQGELVPPPFSSRVLLHLALLLSHLLRCSILTSRTAALTHLAMQGLAEATAQTETSFFFDFELAVAPMLEVLVGKTMQLAFAEVVEEQEQDAKEISANDFDIVRNIELVEKQRLEVGRRRRDEEKANRIHACHLDTNLLCHEGQPNRRDGEAREGDGPG